MPQLHAIIHGRVQGVSFRYHTREEALQLGLTGWVRNLDDGTVETVANGSREMLDQFWAWLQHGPAGARVTRIEPTWWEEIGEEFRTFEIRYTRD